MLPLALGGCGLLFDLDARASAEIHLQVHGEGGFVHGASVLLFNYGVQVARGVTDERGQVLLEGDVVRVAPTTARSQWPWISVKIEKTGFLALELPLTYQDVVGENSRYLLTRGVALRRAS